jgi:exonuclease SbcD
MENYGRTNPQTGLSTRVTDFLYRLDDMIAYAQEREVDLAIFAGDAFKNRNPNPTLQREFAWRIQDLSNLCPVVLLVGNHDLPINAKKASSIEIYETLNVPNVILGQHYEVHHIQTKSGPVQVATAPYPIRARLMEEEIENSVRRTVDDLDALLQKRVELIIRDLAMQADESDAPRILTGHFSVLGAMRGSEKQVMLGRDVAISLGNLATPEWDYIAMGHIHKHQNLTAGRDGMPPLVYCGSLERIDFGEEGDEKGFVWAEVERGAASWNFVPVRARPFVTLRADVRQAGNPMKMILDTVKKHDVTDAVVRVIIEADMETNALIQTNPIEQALREAGASVIASIQRDVDQPSRMRLGPTPEGLSPLELLERYLQSKEISPARIAVLMEAAHNMIEDPS